MKEIAIMKKDGYCEIYEEHLCRKIGKIGKKNSDQRWYDV
jgi:hypothetical protein